MDIEQAILENFKAIIRNDIINDEIHVINNICYVGAKPTKDEHNLAQELYRTDQIKTLFTRTERENLDLDSLLKKQFLHYIETYGLDMDGNFTTEIGNNKIFTVPVIRAITKDKLSELIHDIIYSNKPASNINDLVAIIKDYNIDYDFDKIQNHEIKIELFDENKHKLSSGDEVMRYIS